MCGICKKGAPPARFVRMSRQPKYAAGGSKNRVYGSAQTFLMFLLDTNRRLCLDGVLSGYLALVMFLLSLFHAPSSEG